MGEAQSFTYGTSSQSEIKVRKPKYGDIILADDKKWTVMSLATDKYGDVEKVGAMRLAWYGERTAWFNVHSILFML